TQPVAALPVPGDDLVAELPSRVLRVGKLPVVLEMKALAHGRHTRREVDAEKPPRAVDLVRPVVADLARAPVREPVPVVVDDVVAIRGARRRPLPELVVEIRGNGRGLSLADADARVGVPTAREIRGADLATPNVVQRLEEMRPRARLSAQLDPSVVLPRRFHEELVFTRIVSARLLD